VDVHRASKICPDGHNFDVKKWWTDAEHRNHAQIGIFQCLASGEVVDGHRHLGTISMFVTERVWDRCGRQKERGKRAEADWKSFGAVSRTQSDFTKDRVKRPGLHS